jgi:hypothetical protein
VEISKTETAILYRLDDARAMLVPLVNDQVYRPYLITIEVKRTMAILELLVTLRRLYAERVHR